MKFNIVQPDGKEISSSSISKIRDFLNIDFGDWKRGAGDSAVECAGETLIVIKVETGILIMSLSDYKAPLITPNQEVKPISHSIGGEPFKIADVCLCTEDVGLNILSYFVENNGALHPDFEWVDMIELLSE